MANVKKINGRVVLTPTPERLGNIDAAILGTDAVNKTQLDALQAEVDAIESGSQSFTDITVSGTTDASSKDTGSIISEGGIGLEKALYAGTSITATTTVTAGTAISLGTDLTGLKEVDHIVTVATTTTAATVGGKITVKGATGATSGAGGAAEVVGGVGGATAGSTGGAVNLTTGASGAGGGPSGAIVASTAAGTVTGAISINSGAGTTNAGNIDIGVGTSGSATVGAATIVSSGMVRKPASTSVGTGGTVTGPQLLGGLITITGATGNVNLPTAAQITTALGATPTGTIIEFYVNAVGMTATNTATLVVGTNMTVQSAPPITGGGTLTITQDTQVMAKFILMYQSATACKIARIA